MLERLNDETRSHHDAADAPWLALTTAHVRRQDYTRHLVITYGFEAPLEGAFAYTLGLSKVIGLRERVRAGLIAQDLLALGVRPSRLAALPQCFSITPFQDIAEALGWMYVIERATLLHESVRRSVVDRVPEARRATAYLCATDSLARARWQSFGVALDNFALDDRIASMVVTAADHAFRRWFAWLDDNYLDQRSAG